MNNETGLAKFPGCEHEHEIHNELRVDRANEFLSKPKEFAQALYPSLSAFSLLNIPRQFHELGNISFYALLKDVGYFEFPEVVSETDILVALRKNPEYIGEWRQHSEDKRTTSGWYLLDLSEGYGVGYVPERWERPIEPWMYPDEATACAAFIKLELEDTRTCVSKGEARRKHRRGK